LPRGKKDNILLTKKRVQRQKPGGFRGGEGSLVGRERVVPDWWKKKKRERQLGKRGVLSQSSKSLRVKKVGEMRRPNHGSRRDPKKRKQFRQPKVSEQKKSAEELRRT